MNSWLERSVNSLAGTWAKVADAWRFGTRPPGGRIVTADPHVDLLDFVTDGMTLTQLRSRLNSALAGELGEGMKLFTEMERKDGRLRSVAGTRRMALTSLDWEVVSAAEMQEEIADKTLGKVAVSYQSSVVRLMVGRIKKARGLKELLRTLGPALLRAMNTDDLAEALAVTEVQAGSIGRISATPKETPKR